MRIQFSMLQFLLSAVVITSLVTASASATLLGDSVTGSLTRDGGPNLFNAPTSTTVSGGATEFQGNILNVSGTVVDGFADFDGTTVTIGFRHVSGNLMLTNGTPVYQFVFSDLDWNLGLIQNFQIVDSSPTTTNFITRWNTDPSTFSVLFGNNDLTVTLGNSWAVGPGEELFVTYAPVGAPVPEPMTAVLLLLGLAGIASVGPERAARRDAELSR